MAPRLLYYMPEMATHNPHKDDHMCRIVAYRYTDAIICPSCMSDMLDAGDFHVTLPRGTDDDYDMHGIPMQVQDDNGNDVVALFNDKPILGSDGTCADCGERIV